MIHIYCICGNFQSIPNSEYTIAECGRCGESLDLVGILKPINSSLRHGKAVIREKDIKK